MLNWLKKIGWSVALLLVLILASLVFFTTQLSNRLTDVPADGDALSQVMESPILAVNSATPSPTVFPPTDTATPTSQPSPSITNTPLPSPVRRATPTPLPTPLPLLSLVGTLSPGLFAPQPIITTIPTPTVNIATETPTAIVLEAAPNSPIATPISIAPTVPAPTPVVDGVVVQVPILMYHFLSIPPETADIYRQDLSVSPEDFEAQLAYLKEENFTTISMDDLIAHLAGLMDLPEKPIILTFDDGYADNYTNAFPLLKKYDFTATFFLVTQSIDFADPNYISWNNVIEMHSSGMKFGAHTHRHLDLRNRDVDFLLLEIVGSKEAIEARIQEPVRHFVYPAGRYDSLVLDVVESGGFWSALTTQYGYEHDHANRFELPRIRMRREDTLAIFKAKVNVGE